MGVVYVSFALWNGLRMTVMSSQRFFHAIRVVCAALVICSIPIALDSRMNFLPDLIGISLAIILGFSAMMAAYAVLLGLVLLSRETHRRIAIQIIGISGLSLALAYGILNIPELGEQVGSSNGG